MPANAVYAAEDQWSAVLDRGGVVDFFGSRLDVPMQLRFGDVASVQAYVDRVMASDRILEVYPSAGPVTVRPSRSRIRASYRPDAKAIDLPGELWAGREAVVIHELAHHLVCSMGQAPLSAARRWHGREFLDAMDLLVLEMLGESAALLLRAGYDSAGVR